MRIPYTLNEQNIHLNVRYFISELELEENPAYSVCQPKERSAFGLIPSPSSSNVVQNVQRKNTRFFIEFLHLHCVKPINPTTTFSKTTVHTTRSLRVRIKYLAMHLRILRARAFHSN